MTTRWIKASEQLPSQDVEKVIIKTSLGYGRMHVFDFLNHCSLRQEWVTIFNRNLARAYKTRNVLKYFIDTAIGSGLFFAQVLKTQSVSGFRSR